MKFLPIFTLILSLTGIAPRVRAETAEEAAIRTHRESSQKEYAKIYNRVVQLSDAEWTANLQKLAKYFREAGKTEQARSAEEMSDASLRTQFTASVKAKLDANSQNGLYWLYLNSAGHSDCHDAYTYVPGTVFFCQFLCVITLSGDRAENF